MHAQARVLDFLLELIVGFFGLAHAGGDAAALIEGSVNASGHRSRFNLARLRTRIETMAVLGLQRGCGQQFAHDLLDGIKRGTALPRGFRAPKSPPHQV